MRFGLAWGQDVIQLFGVCRLKALFLALPLLTTATLTLAQDAMPWEENGTFPAYSTTAEAVTGDITLRGGEVNKILTTAGGAEIPLIYVEDSSSAWNLGDPEVWSGGIFAVAEDPGELENGNYLCGADWDATFVVFTPIELPGMDPILQMAVFGGDQPDNIDDPDLCGTYNYVIE